MAPYAAHSMPPEPEERPIHVSDTIPAPRLLRKVSLKRLSLSKLQLARACSAWTCEDSIPELPPNKAGAPANEGNAFHWVTEWHVDQGSAQPLDQLIVAAISEWDLDKEAAARLRNRVEAWTETYEGRFAGAKTEVSYAINVETMEVRELGQHLERDYGGLKDGEIAGTADLVQVMRGNGGDYVLVYDWKTGNQTASARDSLQLWGLGYAAAKMAGVNKAVIVLSYVGEATVYEDWYELTDFAIDHAFPSILKEVTGEATDFQPGPHCSNLYCPAVAVCPKTSQAIEVVSPAPTTNRYLPIVASADDIVSHQHAAFIFGRLKAISAAVDVYEAGLKEYVDRNGGKVDLGDGTEYRRCEDKIDVFEADRETMNVLAIHLGEEARAIPKMTISKTAVVEATRRKAGTGKNRTALQKALFADLSASGGLRKKDRTVYRVLKKGGKGDIE